MAVSNGQNADATNFNAAFVSKTVESDVVAKINLKESTSGGDINNLQQVINNQSASIATNAANISINAADIATNSSDIVDLQTNQANFVDKVSNETIGGTKTFSGDVIVQGSVTVTGNPTNIQSTDLNVTDRNITVNSGGNDASSEGAGLTIERVGTNGSIVYEDALINKFKVGAESSERELVTVVKDTKANLDLLPQDQALIYYATDLQAYFGSNGAQLVPLGGGGGGGLNFYENGTADQAISGNYTTGNSVVFDNGGTFQGTFALTTVNTIRGSKSFQYTLNAVATTSNNDWIASETIAIPRGYRGRTLGCAFQYLYSGLDSDINIIIKDVTNNAILESFPIKQQINANGNAIAFAFSFDCPTDCEEIVQGFQVVNHATGSEVLKWDDVEITPNPFVYKNIDRENVFSARIANNGTATLTSSNYDFIESVSRTAQGNVTVTFKTGFFSEIPSVTAQATGATDANDRFATIPRDTLTVNACEVSIKNTAATLFDEDFDIIVQRQGSDYGQTTEHVITPVKNDVNVFSAKISNNGSVASLISQSSPFISSVSRDSTGLVTINFVTDHFTEIPSCTPVPSTTAGNRDVTCYSHELTTSGCKITIENISSNTGQDENFDIMFQRQDEDVRNAILLSAIPNNLYSAFYSQSTASIVDQSPNNFVTSFARSGTNNVTKTIGISLGLSSAPNVTATPDSRDSAAAAVQYRKDLSSATSLVFETSRTDGNASDDPFTFFIHKP